jgi:pilus assembly protein CpaF
MTRDSMIADGYCTKEILELLTNCVKARMNFVFCGEPGVGKTEGIKFFSQFIPANERVITIEDTPELHFREINPNNDCVELMVSDGFSYTKAIKTSLRQNPKWLMLSEAI